MNKYQPAKLRPAGTTFRGVSPISLKQKLDAMKRQAAENIPQKTFSEMLAATNQLRESGILDGVVKPNSILPEFRLKNQDGIEIFSNELLAEKNLVITIFRGHW